VPKPLNLISIEFYCWLVGRLFLKKKPTNLELLRSLIGSAKVLGDLHGEVHCAYVWNEVISMRETCPYPFTLGEVHCADEAGVEFNGETHCAEFNEWRIRCSFRHRLGREISACEPQVVHRMCVAKMHFRVNQHIGPHLGDGIGDSVEGRTTRIATCVR